MAFLLIKVGKNVDALSDTANSLWSGIARLTGGVFIK
jgi:hypothetical protein